LPIKIRGSVTPYPLIENTNLINSSNRVRLGVRFVFYTIYKITNTKDGKEYIGKHQTKDLDDGYMGSGKHLKRAIEKYGVENFRKEILHVFDTEDEMNAKEAKIVTEEYCARDDTYNLCPGGHGGWGYINGNKELRVAKNKKAAKIANEKGAYIKGGQKVKEVYPEGVFKGCKHDEQTRKKSLKE
jgi:hypothetical protein